MKGLADRKTEKLLKGFQETLKDTSVIDDALFVPAGSDVALAERAGFSNYSYWRSTFQVFFKNKFTLGLIVFLTLLLIFTFIQPWLPNQKSPTEINLNPATNLYYRNVQPNNEFWFGTNNIGQDLWGRIWSGIRTSLFIGICSTLFSNTLGIFLGAVWGYARRWDHLFTEVYNVFDNIPYTVLRMLLIYILRPSISTMVLVMCLTGWVSIAKNIRNLILIHRDREYNLASRCLGSPAWRIVIKNLLPQLISVIVLQIALGIPLAIGSEVFLTYIGLGLPVDTPSLGNLINEGRKVMLVARQRYQLLYPLMAVSAITISFYILGNTFADASDPRNHR